MKLSRNNLANSFTLTTVVLWVACSALVALFPEPARVVTEWMMHGMKMDPYALNINNFILGGVVWTIIAWITGYVLGWSFEVIGKKEK